MSVISADTLQPRVSGAAVTTVNGLCVGGACTATSLVASGVVSSGGILSITDTTESTSSTTGALVVTGGVGIAKSLNVGGNVTVGGTLTYEDVTNQDVIGLATFRSGAQFGSAGVGGTITGTGNVTFTGIVTAASFSGNATSATVADGLQNTPTIDVGSITGIGVTVTGVCTVAQGTNLNGYKVEEGSYDTTALNGEFDFELENGHIQTHNGNTAGTYFPDFRVSSSQSLSSVMDVGDVVSATLIVKASNTAHYCTTGIKIDNSTSNLTIEWIGSSAPSAGKGAGFDIYAFTIQKTAATPAYLIIVNATDAG